MTKWTQSIIIHTLENHQRRKLIPYFPLMTKSVIQGNCRGLRLSFDELSLLVAVCLQETFLKDTDNITVRGFNLYHKFQEIEDRASGVFPFL